MKHCLLLLLPVSIAGCATTVNVPVVKEAQKCEPPPAMLESCGKLATIRQGVTFGEFLEVSSSDRDALEACALRHKRLVETIAECNGSIDRYNAEIREINAIKAKR
jgi:hypothetical protein